MKTTDRLLAVLDAFFERRRAATFFDGTKSDTDASIVLSEMPDAAKASVPEDLREPLEELCEAVLLPAIRERTLGQLTYLPIETVIPDYKYVPRNGILDLISQGNDPLRAGYRQTAYFQDQLARANEETAILKVWRYLHLYQSMKTRGIRFDVEARTGLPFMFMARNSAGKDIAFRLDGTHRASAARHLGYREMPVLAVVPEDVLALPNLPEKFEGLLQSLTQPEPGAVSPFTVVHDRVEVAEIIRNIPCWYQDIEVLDGLHTITPPPDTLRKLVRMVRPKVSAMKNESLVEALPDLRGRRVLDIGCNAGLHSFNAYWRGASAVTGIDMEQERIDQARMLTDLFKGLGRRTENISFKRASITENLDHLNDVDTVLACCVLYHVGPVNELKQAIRNSPVDLFFFQCNTVRGNKIGKKNKPSHPHYEAAEKTWGNILGTIEGGRRFLEDCGFAIDHITNPNSQFPTLVGRRRLH